MEQRLGYDQLADEQESDRMTRRLRQPQGRRRDASIVGLYMDALRHKDGSLTVAYEITMSYSMFADDQLVDIRYDDMARMLAFDKPHGTLVQFRYATTPDPGNAINSVITLRARAGNHVLAGLLQASNQKAPARCPGPFFVFCGRSSESPRSGLLRRLIRMV